MRTVERPSPTSALLRLRTPVDRVRRTLMAQKPAVRLSLALGAFLALAGMSYWAMTSISTLGVRYLSSKRPFSSDDLIKICRALDKQRVAYQVDEQRRVEVAADQYDQAADVVSKLELGQLPIDEIRSDPGGGSFWQLPSEREEKARLAREKMLERIIGEQTGVAWSVVSLNRPRSSTYQRSASKPSAFVYIDTEGGRMLPSRTVQSIPTILVGLEPDLTPAAITVMDTRGNRYFDSGNPALGDSARHRAREEEVSAEILEKLGWIKGVRVQVQVVLPRTAGPIVGVSSAGAAARHPGEGEHRPNADGLSLSEPGSSAPAFAVNQPLPLEPESGSAPHARAPIGASARPAAALTAGMAADGIAGTVPLAEHDGEHGRVLIYVPRSFYYNAEIRSDNREPSREELLAMAERTEKQIRAAVGLVLPSAESWKVNVDTIPDDVALSRPATLPSSTETRRRLGDWGVVGVIGAVISVLAAVGSWIQVGRRPARRVVEQTLTARRFHADSASEAGPSDRVRELIRRSPEAAASVLQRWSGQGGPVT